MARNSGPYAKKRVKVNKKDLDKKPFSDEIYTRRNKRIVLIVVGIIVLSMTATLIVPYFANTGANNWQLSQETLTAEESVKENNYTPKSITLGETFNRPDKEYYVVYGNGENINALDSYLIRAAYYTVDTSQFINKEATNDIGKGKALPQNPAEIKVKKDVALIKIKDGKAVEFFDTKDAALAYAKKIK